MGEGLSKFSARGETFPVGETLRHGGKRKRSRQRWKAWRSWLERTQGQKVFINSSLKATYIKGQIETFCC